MRSFASENTTEPKNISLELGTDGDTKTDEFSEKFQTAFDPLIFGKSCCGFRDKIATKVRMFIMARGTVVYYMILFPMRCM